MDKRLEALYRELTGLELPNIFGVRIRHNGSFINVRVRCINSNLYQIMEGDLKFFVITSLDINQYFPDWPSDLENITNSKNK